MISLSALVVSSFLLAAPDVTPSQTRQAPPASYQSDPAALRPGVIALSAVGGLALGGVGGYWYGVHSGGGSIQYASVAMVGALVGGVGAAGLAAVLTSQWGKPPPITIIPTAGGRETGGVHLLVRF
ncbi:MAG TPA: hypothetical protein VFA20_18355 [Myxococcaceae bacterium]|nr:hypothetical protein [Myxococcaceae bacterium]